MITEVILIHTRTAEKHRVLEIKAIDKVIKIFLFLISLFILVSCQKNKFDLNRFDELLKITNEFYTDHEKNPINLIENFSGVEIKIINNSDKNKIINYVNKIDKLIMKKYNQTYPIGTDILFYKLLKINFPKLQKFEIEGNRLIYFDRINYCLRNYDDL